MHYRIIMSVVFVLISGLMLSCSDNEEENQVHITGKLINWGNASKVLNSNSIQADFGLAENFVLKTNEFDEFELTFDLVASTYFSLGRNKLFIQPGDELYLEVDYKDPEAAVFKGDGAEMQKYLSGVAFPKSGSYLEGGRGVKDADIDHVLQLAHQKTNERRALLELLKEVSPEFLKLEKMRLKLDHLNTVLSFPIYGSFKDYWEYNENKKVEILLQAKEHLNNMALGIMQDEFMKHPNFRDMLLTLVNGQMQEAGIFTSLNLTPFMQDYDEMGAFVTELELYGLNEDMQSKADVLLQSNLPKTYLEMVNLKLAEYDALITGQPAFDVTFKTVENVPTTLSQFKGKLIYVDLWATWCGPCIDELPAFEQLRLDYAGKEITFLPVSIDTDLEAWKKYLVSHELTENELVINRLDLADYKVITIPRYLLIDKDFKIINVFAPKPSMAETRELIDGYLE